MSSLVPILSTKVLSPSQRETLVNAYFSVIEEDFIATKNQNFDLTEINSNLIFTSQNAAQSVFTQIPPDVDYDFVFLNMHVSKRAHMDT